jgi:choline dehydrogenase-like flavoprotein
MAEGAHYDVIVIGTGAGGGTLAHRLAPSGKRILLLERGPDMRREAPGSWPSGRPPRRSAPRRREGAGRRSLFTSPLALWSIALHG